MGVLKVVLIIALFGLVRGQQQVDDVFRAYSPGSVQYGGGPGAYRATPRLVPVKVRQSHHPNSLRPPRPLYYHNYRQEQTSQSRTRPVRVPPYDTYNPYKSGQPIRVLKRVRVSPSSSPYAAVVDQPVEFRHTVPAVSTFKVSPYQQQQQALAQHQQPTYYAPQPVQPSRPFLKAQRAPAKGEEQLEDEYPADKNPQYNFAFDVKDDDLTNYQNRQESRDNGVVKGSYSVVDPDGYVRTVTYEATPKGGFQAKVTREKTDVKIKFPVPTEAPEVKKGPSYSPQGQYQQPQYQPSYASQPHYASPQYAPQAAVQPQYVSRRFPQQGHRLAPNYSQ